ncbi:ABC transporter transmembrane domain-containing protein [Hydrogenophaga sp.]|uniref:ABC transporter transmembrane domain-containing protein n=1 Tax=Hydrogenophaga sp. TaxID=1904254 RepID=UPI00260745D4|nr:ABC transporter transmembrane domain-containing protein [Hydrogenophaga sp.]MCW5653562.1 ATP-binding cassette domain-containing protein [Hydrogenophaga sp.]
MPASTLPARPTATTPTSLGGLLPFLRPYRLQIALALLFLVLAAVATLLFPLALRTLIDQGLAPAGRGEQVMALREHFALLFAVAVALGLFSAARFYLVSWLGERVTADLRNAVYSHVLRQSPQFFETTQTGEVLSRLTTDTTLVQTVVGSSLSMGLRNGVMGLGALVMLVWTNPYVMTQVLLILVLVVLPSMWFGRRVRRLSRASQDRVADSSAIAAEVLNAIPIVQSYTAEDREAARFADSTRFAFEAAVRRTKARSVLVAFIIISTAALLLWGLYQGTQAVLAGTISPGHLGQTVLYVIILASAVAVLGEVYGDLLRAAGASERLMELLTLESPVQSPAQPLQASAPQGGSALAFEDVTFHYPSRPAQAALSGFSLAVQPGRTVALVGPSGAGKSTVFGLLLRYYDPAQGRILLDGVPIQRLALQALRERIGIVPQDPVIFSTSALENIRYGRPGASDEEVRAAAKAAFADEFIEKLPEGYGTFLGERGVRLSGGQRQRIAIARAMLKNPPLLLLDEATSALDAQSERMVQAALESAMKDRTTLVIAHRLATVQQADHIVVLEHGRLVEQGTHQTLVAAGGVYARLAALQFTA